MAKEYIKAIASAVLLTQILNCFLVVGAEQAATELAELIRQYTDAHLKGIYRFRKYFVGEQEKSIH